LRYQDRTRSRSHKIHISTVVDVALRALGKTGKEEIKYNKIHISTVVDVQVDRKLTIFKVLGTIEGPSPINK
jgi:hypothetical protein